MFARLAACCLLLLGLVGLPVHADELTAEKKADIERLIAMTGGAASGRQMAALLIDSMTKTLKTARPDIPQKALDVLPEEAMAVLDQHLPALNAMMAPIYHRQFTGPEVQELIAFYSGDLGKKMIRVMPQLMQETLAVSQRWGAALGPQVNQRIKARLKREGIAI